MATVGENVVTIRKERGWSQATFADRLGVRQPSVWKLEKSKAVPHGTTLLKLAIALGCTVERLVAGVNVAYDKAVEGAAIAELAHVVARQHRPPSLPVRPLKKKSAR